MSCESQKLITEILLPVHHTVMAVTSNSWERLGKLSEMLVKVSPHVLMSWSDFPQNCAYVFNFVVYTYIKMKPGHTEA
jgi:hypothetical protein